MTAPHIAKPVILVVEDEYETARHIQGYLEEEGYRVVHACDIIQAKHALLKFAPTLIVLDIALGDDLDAGFRFCRDIRSGGLLGDLISFKDIPILMLTIRSKEEEVTRGFAHKANVYLCKPFGRAMLVGHVKALVPSSITSFCTFGSVRIDELRGVVWINGKELPTLSDQEFRLLFLLIEAQGEALSDEELLQKVTGSELIYRTSKDKIARRRNIDVLVSRLRRKIKDVGEEYCDIIQRVSGMRLRQGYIEAGYKIVSIHKESENTYSD